MIYAGFYTEILSCNPLHPIKLTMVSNSLEMSLISKPPVTLQPSFHLCMASYANILPMVKMVTGVTQRWKPAIVKGLQPKQPDAHQRQVALVLIIIHYNVCTGIWSQCGAQLKVFKTPPQIYSHLPNACFQGVSLKTDKTVVESISI